MTNDETRPRQPVMRRATAVGCPGWTPIARPAVEPAPVIFRIADEAPAAPASVDDASSPAANDLPRR
jgi:hypothetical protein